MLRPAHGRIKQRPENRLQAKSGTAVICLLLNALLCILPNFRMCSSSAVLVAELIAFPCGRDFKAWKDKEEMKFVAIIRWSTDALLFMRSSSPS